MKTYDLIGIGAGPANLSLAALSLKTRLKTIFIDKQKEFLWHPGMLLSEAKLQVSFLKDLVTLVDPTNPYSFLNFLTEKGCLYQFITADFSKISRLEFSEYLKWAFDKISSIKKDEEVISIKFQKKILVIKTTKDTYLTKSLVLGTGLTPYTPQCCKKILGSDVYHNAYFLKKEEDFTGKRVAIIGGGQSGAEIACHLLSNEKKLPATIFWLSKRLNFLPIDDSPFTNELFTPKYTQHFYQLDANKKQSLLFEHKLASDGISQATAEEIYRKLYEFNFIKNRTKTLCLLPSHQLHEVKKKSTAYALSVLDIENNAIKELTVDKVILCTGYTYQEPDFLSEIKNMLHYNEHGLAIKDHYQVCWDGMDACTIYMQNGAKHTHGIADPNLSLLAYRSATILNHMMGEKIYPNINGSTLVHWSLGEK